MFQGFQRIQGAINARIAEEQARQKAAQQSERTRSTSTPRRSNSRNLSPSKRPIKGKDADNGKAVSLTKGPDPAEFDPEFVVGEEDEQASRSDTPQPKINTQSTDSTVESDDKSAAYVSEQLDKERQIPAEVQTRLRKLDKLEPKYSELLRSYRIAHARISTIETFENSLREHTPLTSISDSAAFVEYLSQLNVKSDMLMEELKRVTKERDEVNKTLVDAENRAKKALEHVEASQSQQVACAGSETVALSSSPDKPKSDEGSEEFFSYDSELPRMQSQLQMSEEKVIKLEEENTSLKAELSSAQESAKFFMKNLETTTNDLNTFKDTHQKLQQEAEQREKNLDAMVVDLQAKVTSAEHDLYKHTESHDRDERSIAELKHKLDSTARELKELHEEKGEKSMGNSQVEELQGQLRKLETDFVDLQGTLSQSEKRNETMSKLLDSLRKQLKNAEEKRDDALTELTQMKKRSDEAAKEKTLASIDSLPQQAQTSQPIVESTSSRKKGKKNKKGGKGHKGAAEISNPPLGEAEDENDLSGSRDAASSLSQLADMQNMIVQLRHELEDKTATIANLEHEAAERASLFDGLKKNLKAQEDMQEEIDTLRQDLLDFGLEHTEAKAKAKELHAEKAILQEKLNKLEKEVVELKAGQAIHGSSEEERQSLTAELEALASKAALLQIDVSVAEKLAASRFKDLTDLKDVLQKAQPELSSLRKEVADLRSAKDELATKTSELRRLEGSEKYLKAEVAEFRSRLADRETDIKTLNEKVRQETQQRLALEGSSRKTQKELQMSEGERTEIMETCDKLRKELAKAQEDVRATRNKVEGLEDETAKLKQEAERLRDDIQLKSAQYASAQDLMNSMQDQTQEIGIQMKEVRARSESLEEELADAHRLLSERGREAETMRRLLNDAQGRADSRVREMQGRLDVAVEERERAEEQASSFNRRRARELEELKQKVREAERAVTRAMEDKEEVVLAEKEVRRQKEEMEKRAVQAREEAGEVRLVVSQLRDTLDESEKQARELEKEKGDLRRAFDETQSRLEKVQKSSKIMSEELRSMKTRGLEINNLPSRHSTDSTRSRLTSPSAKKETRSSQSDDTIDYVYLKNVLLQFLEQRDKKYQQQLIPVLGMLLHFNQTDEEKWTAAVAAR